LGLVMKMMEIHYRVPSVALTIRETAITVYDSVQPSKQKIDDGLQVQLFSAQE